MADLRQLALTAALGAAVGCSPSGSEARPSSDSAAVATPSSATPSFVNRVWVVAESPQVAVGEMRVFLSDGTLVMTSPHATPAFGRWLVTDGELTITEEGRDYPVDVLELTADLFRIRIRGPGEAVVIRFVPAQR